MRWCEAPPANGRPTSRGRLCATTWDEASAQPRSAVDNHPALEAIFRASHARRRRWECAPPAVDVTRHVRSRWATKYEETRMNELVERLTKPQRVEIGTRLADRIEYARGQAERSYVFVKFTETRGGTELGVRVDRDQSDFAALE